MADNLLSIGTQLRSDNLLSRELAMYQLACRVEGKSPRTVEVYSKVLTEFLRFLGERPVNVNECRLFILDCQERGFSPFTTHQYFRTMRTFFNWRIREGLTKDNPMATMRPPKTPRKLVAPFTGEDLSALLATTDGRLRWNGKPTFYDLRNRALILIFLDTGLRLSEVADMRKTDLDVETGTIKVMGKGAKERMVRIGLRTRQALLRYMMQRLDELPELWLSEERFPMTADGIQCTVVKLCHRAKITEGKHGPHRFRHTAALLYLRNGGDVFTLQVMLGHSNLETTRKYLSTLGADDMMRVHEKASPVDRLFQK